MSESMFFLTIKYNDGDQSTYKSVDVSNSLSGEKKSFNLGDPCVDWIDAWKFIWEHENIIAVTSSSTVDHFTFDGDAYKWKVFLENWEQIVPNHIETLEECQAHYRAYKTEHDPNYVQPETL
jgi:hypothetical protein